MWHKYNSRSSFSKPKLIKNHSKIHTVYLSFHGQFPCPQISITVVNSRLWKCFFPNSIKLWVGNCQATTTTLLSWCVYLSFIFVLFVSFFVLVLFFSWVQIKFLVWDNKMTDFSWANRLLPVLVHPIQRTFSLWLITISSTFTDVSALPRWCTGPLHGMMSREPSSPLLNKQSRLVV